MGGDGAGAGVRHEKIAYKVRNQSDARVPLVVGKREAETGTVAVRKLGSQDRQVLLSLSEVLDQLAVEIIPPDLRECRPHLFQMQGGGDHRDLQRQCEQTGVSAPCRFATARLNAGGRLTTIAIGSLVRMLVRTSWVMGWTSNLRPAVQVSVRE
jgi:hypothetical protein